MFFGCSSIQRRSRFAKLCHAVGILKDDSLLGPNRIRRWEKVEEVLFSELCRAFCTVMVQG
jgi:hypothetical protein